jgi:hypothetical protein
MTSREFATSCQHAITAISNRIERLELWFQADSLASQGFFLAHRPWPVLRMAQMALMPIYFVQLRTFLGLYKSYNEPQLDLNEVKLLSGKWAEALDMI